jgi:hypothetical protein
MNAQLGYKEPYCRSLFLEAVGGGCNAVRYPELESELSGEQFALLF